MQPDARCCVTWRKYDLGSIVGLTYRSIGVLCYAVSLMNEMSR